MPSSQNGWPLSQPNARTRWTMPQITGSVLAGPVWVVLFNLIVRFADRVEPVQRTKSWGYSYRRIAGSSKWSNHASATAVDLNAPAHPAGRKGTFTKTQYATIKAILGELGGVVRHGEVFSDGMHFEIAPKTSRAEVTKVATRLLQARLVAHGHDLGDYGPRKDGVDGVRGDKTDAAVKAFQVAHDLDDDGIDGPKTWAALITTPAKENAAA